MLTAQNCIDYNASLTAATSSIHGVRDRSALESAIARFENKLAYDEHADILLAAASVMEGIIRNHPFIDGNKRTAMQALKRILVDAHIVLDSDAQTQFSVVLAVAEKTMSAADVGEWLRAESHKDTVYTMLSDYDSGLIDRNGVSVGEQIVGPKKEAPEPR